MKIQISFTSAIFFLNLNLFLFSAEIGAFYLVFYTILLGFFVGMLAVFYQTIDGDRPRLTGESSLLKGNPGKNSFLIHEKNP